MIQLLIANSLFIMGLWIITRYGAKKRGGKSKGLNKKVPERWVYVHADSMFFGWFGFMAEKWMPRMIHKPLISCVTCMASIHGAWFYFAYYHVYGDITREVVLLFPIYAVMLASINTMLWVFYERNT